ncbi:PTS-dependent dihydroxyacetone kinase 1, dihydroxyacetone-binding subunit DhaK-like [Bombus impatiens]|uniref:PTS-dependent dihydroxyacetone kinase 1, dihydroxyacetone-binding subunit DhaK-like n=1 Tax=Bombus impatiens TaxID=132113 RepID=A0A6P8LAV9_BOMIM|nr:PTS-dependent dihydroxyacetone kinase 1, dihydroxyacetone-binding subunit DhaK-like [Bombus impatiens]XP_033178973.1 PTS-dependent dihydroxyacetone kinase 1, dihydroxyacetone-binding subunit DhaK-like [Bombus impatiens]
MFELGDDEIEVGQGIHGEAGYEKMKLKPCSEIVAFMLKRLREALSLKSGDSVAVIINNFGALSQLEQGIVVYDVVKHLLDISTDGIQVKTEYEIHMSTVTDQRTNRELKNSCSVMAVFILNRGWSLISPPSVIYEWKSREK